MKDRDLLLLVSLTFATLIFTNFSLFLKSLSSGNLVSPKIQQLAREIQLEGWRKKEQEFWRNLKEVDFDKIAEQSSSEENIASESEEKNEENPESKPAPSRAQTPANQKLKSQSAPGQKKSEKPHSRFLLIGDSIMFDLGTALQHSLKKKYNISQIKLAYKVSSGLTRSDYYDWNARTKKLIAAYKPDVIVVMFGGNDNQEIVDSRGNSRAALTDEWKKLYRQKVEKYAKLVSDSSVKKVYWVGQPKTNRSRFQKFFPAINEIYRDVSKSHPKFEFVSSWESFSVKGQYAPVVADKSGKKRAVKARDGVHFTAHGARIISDLVIDRMVEDKILKVKDKSPKVPVNKKK